MIGGPWTRSMKGVPWTRSTEGVHRPGVHVLYFPLFEKGLKATLACNENIVMRHDVMRALFPGLPSDLRTTPYRADKDEMIAAGLGPYLKTCLTVTGGVLSRGYSC